MICCISDPPQIQTLMLNSYEHLCRVYEKPVLGSRGRGGEAKEKKHRTESNTLVTFEKLTCSEIMDLLTFMILKKHLSCSFMFHFLMKMWYLADISWAMLMCIPLISHTFALLCILMYWHCSPAYLSFLPQWTPVIVLQQSSDSVVCLTVLGMYLVAALVWEKKTCKNLKFLDQKSLPFRRSTEKLVQ